MHTSIHPVMHDGKKHYDAAGHLVYSWNCLIHQITHKPSQALLKKSLLCKVVVHPFIQIRVPKPFLGHVEVIHYGTGCNSCRSRDLDARAISALRRFYKRAWRSGWTVEDGPLFVTFSREARVTRDPLRRW